MRKESVEFLKKLVTTPSPSGFEAEAQQVCRAYAEPFSDEVYKDVHGNQYHVKNPCADLRIMLAGHVDEIALMVNDIDDDGFIGFVAIGGIDPSVLDGQRVTVHSEQGNVPGCIGRTAIHLTDKEERGKPLELHKLWVDIGAASKDEAEGAVAIGDPITVDVGYVELMNERVVARAFDDRIGAFVIIEALRLLKGVDLNCTVYAVTTVQEEIGLRGAKTSAFACDPQAGLAVDVGHAVDYPQVDKRRHREGKIGQGPILYRGPNINPVVERQLIDTAKGKEIPYQMAAAPRGTGTDANAMQVSRAGVATGLISIPNRYMHSPVELLALPDVENASKLIAEWLGSLEGNEEFIP